MENTAQIDGQKLHFGNFAIRKFCRLQECSNDPTSILQEFAGEKAGDALFNIVKAGLEAGYASEKKPFGLDDFDVSGYVDKLNSRQDKGESVINAFLGSVINKPASEVPDWIKEVEKEAKRLADEEANVQTATQPESDPNAEAVTSDSQPGKKLKAAPSVTV